MRPIVALALLGVALPVAGVRAADLDTEHMFGFSEGTDIGVLFQPEGEVETVGRVGKQAGTVQGESSRPFAAAVASLVISLPLGGHSTA